MGFFEIISGRKKVLSFEIVFDDNNNVGVNVTRNVSVVPTPDYIRLWASYEAKMIYNLGYPNNVSANMAIGAVAKVVHSEINETTDCFRRANLDDVVHYIQDMKGGNTKFTAEFYAKGSIERTIKTWFPVRSTEQQGVYSTLALMQYAISMTRDDNECLNVFTRTARNMITLYESGMGVGVGSIVRVPTLAYLQAIGVRE